MDSYKIEDNDTISDIIFTYMNNKNNIVVNQGNLKNTFDTEKSRFFCSNDTNYFFLFSITILLFS